MVERRIGFDDYVRKYRLEAVEGLLLRYLSSVYGTLLRNVPNSAKNESIEEIEGYLHSEISNVDSSLLREWETRLHNNKSAELGLYLNRIMWKQPPSYVKMRILVGTHLI